MDEFCVNIIKSNKKWWFFSIYNTIILVKKNEWNTWYYVIKIYYLDKFIIRFTQEIISNLFDNIPTLSGEPSCCLSGYGWKNKWRHNENWTTHIPINVWYQISEFQNTFFFICSNINLVLRSSDGARYKGGVFYLTFLS